MASPVKQESGGVNVMVRGSINKKLKANTDEDEVAEPYPEAKILSYKVNRISELGRRSIITKQRLSAFKRILMQSARERGRMLFLST
jgi:hypothetical protein